MSCSTVVVVVAINVIAAGREGEAERGSAAAGEDLHVSFVVCQFNYLDINCQRNDVPSVFVCMCSQFTCTHTQAERVSEFCYCQQANHVGVLLLLLHPVADCGDKRMLK